MHGAWIPLFVMLWLVVVLLAVLVTGLIRRITTLELKRAEPARHHHHGPAVGSRAPTVAGHEHLSAIATAERGRIFLFLAGDGDATAELVGELETADAEARSAARADLVVVLDAAVTPATSLPSEVEVVIDVQHELARGWGIPGTPFAVALDADGVVRGATFVADALSALRLAAALPSLRALPS